MEFTQDGRMNLICHLLVVFLDIRLRSMSFRSLSTWLTAELFGAEVETKSFGVLMSRC